MDFLSKVKENIDEMISCEKPFIHDDFMLTNDFARELYHESAEKMPIIDYHCHLVPKMIADNYQFKDLTEATITNGGQCEETAFLRISSQEVAEVMRSSRNGRKRFLIQ